MIRRAVIVASGPSARGFVPPDNLTVIAVNGAIDWLPRADYWFSLDPSAVNVARLREKRLPDCEYHVAASVSNLGKWGSNWATYWTRRDSCGVAREPEGIAGPEWWLWRLGAIRGICKEPGCIHTGNSAWGALGLAWHLGIRDVALMGVDATAAERVEGGRPNVLSHLPLLFASAAPDMRVVSCGAMGGICRMPFQEWYDG